MQIRYTVDGVSLENLVIDAVGSRRDGCLTSAVEAPILIVVPTRRLVDHLKRRCADEFGATLGVYVVTHRELAVRAVECALQLPPRVLSETALLELVTALLEDYQGEQSRYLREHLSARRHLAAAFRDLREAGLTPQELSSVDGANTAVADLYPAYTRALEKLSADGLTDEAGLIQASLPHVPSFLRRKGIRHVLHHGAYELTAVHLELLFQCDRTVAVELLLPGELEGGAFEISKRFVTVVEAVRQRPVKVSRATANGLSAERRQWVERLACLYDAESRWDEPLSTPGLEIWHSQGAESELRIALLRALAFHSTHGIPLRHIHCVARSLEPYVSSLQEVCSELGLPFTTSATVPLRRLPGVAQLLLFLRVLARDFERQAVIDLLRSGALRCRGFQDHSEDVDRWDRWSRRARITCGLGAWRELATAGGALATADERRSMRALTQVLDVLEAKLNEWRKAGPLEEHVVFLQRLIGDVLIPTQPLELESFNQHLENMLETLEMASQCHRAMGGVESTPSPTELEERLSQLADSERVPVSGQEETGVRILDLMQTRGMVHPVLIWIGFQHDLFPRHGHPNSPLSDPVREALWRATGRPIYPKLEARLEERLLLALTLGAVEECFVLSFQRADDDGKKKARSSALREVARVFLGRPNGAELLCDSLENPFRPERVPTHVEERATMVSTSRRLGLYPLDDGLVASCVGGERGVDGARQFLESLNIDRPDLHVALGAVENLESYQPSNASHDGLTGIGCPSSFRFSPTGFERLAKCPLSFFLANVLGVRELEREAVPYRLEAGVLGTAVHRTLANLYRELCAQGAFPLQKKKFRDTVETACGRLRVLWTDEVKEAAGESYRRLRGLYRLLGDVWLTSLERFVQRDLAELLESGAEPIDFEKEIESELALPGGESLWMAGRFDRLFRQGDTILVDDYKTSGAIDTWVQPSEYLRGDRLQLPLYREMLASMDLLKSAAVRARLLGVGPKMKIQEATLELDSEVRKGFLETVGVLLRLAQQGWFPAYSNSPMCSYCSYRRTCRRKHEPTLRRFESDPKLADFRDCKEKRARQKVYTLAEVRRRNEDEPGHESHE